MRLVQPSVCTYAECTEFYARLNVPQLSRRVHTAGGHNRALGAEGETHLEQRVASHDTMSHDVVI